MSEIIRLENVVKLYPPRRRIVNGVGMSVAERERLCICGAPGSGKTTLMRLIAGMESTSAGSIFVQEKPIQTFNADTLADFRNRTFGVLQRTPGFIEPLSILENVALPLMIRGVPYAQRQAAAREQLKSLSIPHVIHAKPAQLSTYEAQLASIARAFITKPKILLLDDADADLSAKESDRLFNILSGLWQFGDCAMLYFTGKSCLLPFNKRYILNHGKFQEVQS